MELLGRYKNGNFVTTILSDGTKIRETKDDEFIPSFAENMDVKICNYCDMGCNFVMRIALYMVNLEIF